MTLQNCQRLLKHYNDLVDGTIPRPEGHKNWADVISNAKVRAAEMKERVEHKLTLPQYAVQVPVEKPVKQKEKK